MSERSQMPMIVEKGPWSAYAPNDGKVYVQSSDFTHDVAMQVRGDFANHAQHKAYAEEIARRLNTATQRAEAAEADRDKAHGFIARKGYRRCDIPACNCNSWHGGHALERLEEIGDALTDAGIDPNGGTVINRVRAVLSELNAVRAALRESTEKPCA